ncbi:hypothetical protein [Fructobacillus tropaeoli]|uniref:hypothetical protein n=1 Tax=Fructobacillus tropaeoli TaxID=709323 RepID=UPI001940F042|nr:hypothetical protein [Fructobacillus tropaeoli]GIC70631.1 hypothetical protein FT12353_13070 [Fructobacillus tropaeoli]
MKRHFIKNSQLIFISVEQIFMGIVILMQSTKLHNVLPPILDWTDDVVPGMVYLVLGSLLLVNSLWDFYWYRIRIFLLALSAVMWTMLTLSFGLDMIYSHDVEVMPYLFLVITLRIIYVAWQEPPHKMKGGEHH